MIRNSILRTAADDETPVVPPFIADPGISAQDVAALTQSDDTQFTRGFRSGIAGLSSGRLASEALRLESSGDVEGAARLNDQALRIQQEQEPSVPRVR